MSCEYCEHMRKWQRGLPKLMRDDGVYLEFGATLNVRYMREGHEFRFIIDKSLPKARYCPECGTSLKKRMRQWRNEDEEARET